MKAVVEAPFKYDPWVLQNLVNHIHHVQLALELTVEDTRAFLNRVERNKFKYHFDEKTGLVNSIDYDPELDFDDERIWDMHQDFKQFSLQEAASVHDYLQKFHAAYGEILKILDSLAQPIQSRLSNLRKDRHWVTVVIRFCMLPVMRWPRLPSRNRWIPNGTKYPRHPDVPKRFDQLLELFIEVDPTEYWQQICRRFDSIVDDIVAVAWSFGSEISLESDGPCDYCTWRHSGLVINGNMERKSWLLSKYLFEHKPHPIDFSDLAEPVFGDHAESIDYNKVSNLRTEANSFFEKHGIPWRVGTQEKRQAMLRLITGDSTKPKSNQKRARS